MNAEPTWLLWARELQALAQTGLTFAKDPYDLQRYRRLHAMALEMFAVGSHTRLERIEELFSEAVGYPTPKVDVRGAVFRDGQILLVREISDGCWTVPGGWADVNQSAAECVEREIREESGYEARAVRLAALCDARRQNPARRTPWSIYKLLFICELTGGEARPSVETSEVGFFAEDRLPPLSLGRITPLQIARLFAHWRSAELQTAFD